MNVSKEQLIVGSIGAGVLAAAVGVGYGITKLTKWAFSKKDVKEAVAEVKEKASDAADVVKEKAEEVVNAAKS